MRRYDLIVFGLSVSSSWGNGHATTYRGLLKAYAARGQRVLFLEREQPWYKAHRDLTHSDAFTLAFYDEFEEIDAYRTCIEEASAVMVGSYTPDAVRIGKYVHQHAKGVTIFYDIDTPVTLDLLEHGRCDYLSRELIPAYDLYLSFTGGPTLDDLEKTYRAATARALYCSVDHEAYRPAGAAPHYDLGYLGTYSPDRQSALERLLLEPARRAPHLSFVVGGSQYPESMDWPDNVTRVDHVPPSEHPAFYGACRFTLNVTRADMVKAGYSPSVRLFEAAACGAPIISDMWKGLDIFFAPWTEIAFAAQTEDILRLLQDTSESTRLAMVERARTKVLSAHTAAHRAAELQAYIRAADKHRNRTSTAILA